RLKTERPNATNPGKPGFVSSLKRPFWGVFLSRTPANNAQTAPWRHGTIFAWTLLSAAIAARM
ncbi:hypothetical protein, partial [Marinobacter xestospongiae]